MTTATLDRWGKHIAIRFSRDTVEAAGFALGQSIKIEVRDGEIILRPARIGLELNELFKGNSAEEWREAYAAAYDWGQDVGRERIDE